MKYPYEIAIAKKFMRQITDDFSAQKKAFVVVSHINPTSVPLIQSLSHAGRIAGIIAKPNSIDYSTYERLTDKYLFLDADKHSLLQSGTATSLLSKLPQPDEKLIIIDIGGYFAGSLGELSFLPFIGGIVEDTENGLQKYEAALEHLPNNKLPIYSIARSRAKDFEDYLIGRTIAFSAIQSIKKEKVPHWKNRKFGIIGFGEVGRGAAFCLKNTFGVDVSIYDCNPEVQQKITLSGFQVSSRNNIIKNSEILLCATGHGSLHDEDIQFIKKGCYIASCTSADDEFAFRDFDIRKGQNSPYRTSMINGINFINCGNAVNFMHPDRLERMLSPYIYLTHSALLAAIAELETQKNINTAQIQILSPQREKKLINDFHAINKTFNRNSIFIDKFLTATKGRL